MIEAFVGARRTLSSPKVGIDIQSFYALRQLRSVWLAIEPSGIKRVVPQQGCQTNEIARILGQVIAREGVTERMCTGFCWDQVPCCFHQIRNHLSHG